jgi:hypothetical protein
MAKPNFTLPNKPAIKSGSILSYNYTDDFTFVPAPLTFNRDSAATRVNEKGLIEDVGYFGPELVQNGDFSQIGSEEIVNGDFSSTDISMITGAGTRSVVNGQLKIEENGLAYSQVIYNGILDASKTYKATFDITLGTGFYDIYDTTQGNVVSITSSGSYTFYLKSTNRFYVGSNGVGDVWYMDNISVKEVGQNWETEGSSSLELADFQGRSNVANINILNTLTSSRIRQSFDYVNGKRYKVSVDVYLVSGNFRIDCSDSFVSGNFGSTSTTGSWITLETEIQAISTGSNYIWLRSLNTVSQFYVSNVSVIEILGDKPRIDYSDSLTEPSLLLEPQSTNLVVNSENLSVLNQTTINLVISPDVSPSGKLNSWRATRTGSDNRIGSSFSAVSGLTYTTSIYAKKVSGSGVINITDYQGNPSAYNLTEKWQRYTLTASATSTTGRAYVTLQNIGDVVDFYGLQSEQLSYATSYIPTAGSTATRLGETANNAGDVNVFNSQEGVLYAEIAALASESTSKRITISDGNLTNRITLSIADNVISGFINVNNVTEYTFYEAGQNVTNFNKIAIKYKQNNFCVFINGVQYDIDTNGSTFTANTLNVIKFSNASGSSNDFYGKVRNLKVFNKALTDRELEILTIQ